MKITDVRDSIARDYLEPIIKRLSESARKEFIESVCIPHCGHPPTDGTFCSAYKTFLDMVLENTSRLN